MIWLIVHMMLCCIYMAYRRRGIREISEVIPPSIVFLVPYIGFILWMADCLLVQTNTLSNREIEIDKLKVTDARYRRLKTDTGADSETMVPLEEALIVNDAKMRRNLILDILHRNPEEYLKTLEKAMDSDDVEVTHYATTTVLEIQSEYEQKLQEYMREFPNHQKEAIFLREYADCLRRYVESGLIDGSVLQMQQEKLLSILSILISSDNSNKEDRYLYIETALNLEQYEAAKVVIDEMQDSGYELEKWNRLAFRYYWEMRQPDEMKKILENVKNSNIYLTKDGKEWFRFWSKGMYNEKDEER